MYDPARYFPERFLSAQEKPTRKPQVRAYRSTSLEGGCKLFWLADCRSLRRGPDSRIGRRALEKEEAP
jgi:hypothetical protein